MQDAHPAVAVVDDDEQICLGLQEWLDTLGVESRYYLSAEGLLGDCIADEGGLWWRNASGGPARRLGGAILDLNLPGMHGAELARRLRAMAPGLKVILITAANTQEWRHLGVDDTGAICLKKPVCLDALEAALLPL